jgi:hypothetical protein
LFHARENRLADLRSLPIGPACITCVLAVESIAAPVPFALLSYPILPAGSATFKDGYTFYGTYRPRNRVSTYLCILVYTNKFPNNMIKPQATGLSKARPPSKQTATDTRSVLETVPWQFPPKTLLVAR